eukprot:1914532-Rhodomonas_salina.1
MTQPESGWRCLLQVCTFNRGAIGFCQVATYSANLPSFFQYFSNPAQGGPDGLLDYCPLPTPYTNTRCDGDGAVASLCGSALCRGEEYGAESACFESSVIIDGYVRGSSVASIVLVWPRAVLRNDEVVGGPSA